MNYLITALAVVLLSVSPPCIAQKQGNIWYFGKNNGIDFNSGSPISISGGQTYLGDFYHSEGTASICDSTGSLLFYSNGVHVWDKTHQIMPNGDSLLGGWSSSQAALAIPEPGSSELFYLFTTDAFYPNNLANGFRYSIIDMCLNNGLGDVVPGTKNTLLVEEVSEKLTGVKHSNGIDYWIITHKYNSDEFYSYLLTTAGIVDTVISAVGSVHEENCPGCNGTWAAIGQMKASPDGSRLALVNLNTCENIQELFSFNATTGAVTDPIDLAPNVNDGAFGVSFSPDNTKLYLSANNPGTIYQFDLLAGGGSPAAIVNSMQVVVNLNTVLTGIQLGPDGKIYVAREYESYLGVLHDPNSLGAGCDWEDAYITVSDTTSYGMPNFIDSYDYHNAVPMCETSIEEQSSSFLVNPYPNPVTGPLLFEIEARNSQGLLEIYNNCGSLVRSADIGIGVSEIRLDMSPALTNGLYHCRLTFEDGVGVARFVLER